MLSGYVLIIDYPRIFIKREILLKNLLTIYVSLKKYSVRLCKFANLEKLNLYQLRIYISTYL